MQALAERYAELKGTTLLKSYMNDDGTITFILESGPKMTMSAELLRDAIAAMEEAEEVGSAAAGTPLLPIAPAAQAKTKAEAKKGSKPK